MQTEIVGLVVAVILALDAPGFVPGEAVDLSRPLECGENAEIRCIEPKPKEADQLRVALRPIV